MKITFVSQYYFPEPFSNHEIAKSLLLSGHHIDVLTAVPNYPKGQFYDRYSNKKRRKETVDGIPIERVRTIARGNSSIKLFANFLAFPLFATIAAMSRNRTKPDVVFVSQLSPILMCIPAIILSWRFKVPLVYWVQDIWPESALYTLNIKNKLVTRMLTKFCGWIYRRADLVLVQSGAFPPMIERFGVPSEKIKLFPNTAPDYYRPLPKNSPCAISDKIPAEGFKIMFAGNIGESQDFDTIIEAARILKPQVNIQWLIVGSGRDLERVQRKVAQLDLTDNFHFLGRHPEQDMPAFFSHADAMLVSLKDNPIFSLTVPYKIQCYMACGKPIIASLNGEGARIVKEAGAGVIAVAGSADNLAETISDLASKSGVKLDEMGARSLRYFQTHYLVDLVLSGLDENLKSIKHISF